MRALACVAALLAACSEPPDPATLQQRGEHEVGYRVIEATYTPPGAEARTIPVHAWYPAAPSGEALAVYEVAGIVEVEAGGALAAPAPDTGEAWPLIVYSHGSGGEGLLGYPYGEHLASHGYVVLSPDHLGNVARDALNNSLDPFTRVLVNRPLDVSATLDLGEGGLFGGLEVEPGRALVFGHSFGGYTTLAVGGATLDVDAWIAECEGEESDACDVIADADVQARIRGGFRDDRVVAIVPQAPALIPDLGGLGDLGLPTQLQSGRRDQTTTQEQQAAPAWEALDHPDDLWVELPDGGHYSFVTICDDLSPALLAAFRPDADSDGCGDDFTPVSEAVPLMTAYLHGHANAFLRDEDGWVEILEGEPLGAAVELTAR